MWVEFLQVYSFTFKYKAGVQNVVVDSLSWEHSLLTSLHVKIIRFDVVKKLYNYVADFMEIWKAYFQRPLKNCDIRQFPF